MVLRTRTLPIHLPPHLPPRQARQWASEKALATESQSGLSPLLNALMQPSLNSCCSELRKERRSEWRKKLELLGVVGQDLLKLASGRPN